MAAPPRRWDPSLSLASALLNETATAPWLRPATLASIVADGPRAGIAGAGGRRRCTW